jgi:hypothetical protein
MKDLIEAIDLMIDAGFTDQDVIRLLRSCESQETALKFADFCIQNKLASNNLNCTDPNKTVIVFTKGGFIFKPRHEDKTTPFIKQMMEEFYE